MVIYNFDIQDGALKMSESGGLSERFFRKSFFITRIYSKIYIFSFSVIVKSLNIENINTINGVVPVDIADAVDKLNELASMISDGGGGALPIGASTELKQNQMIVWLTDIFNRLTPNASTEAKQDSQSVILSDIKAKTDNIDVLLSTRTKPSDTQTVSASSLPLPTGASTLAKQDEIISKLNFLTPKLDAFGLQEVASPELLFEAQFTYDLQPLLYGTNLENGTITHDATNRMAVISSTGVGNTYIQSYEYFRYQAGKGQKIYITFNFKDAVVGSTKYAQYGDSINAMGIRLLGNGNLEVFINTGTSQGNQSQVIDAVGLGIDISKEQIFLIQFEALYVGSVQFGMQIGADLVWLHAFDNSNNSDFPYVQTANLPIRVGIISSTAVNTNLSYNCCSVQTSGGNDNVSGYTFAETNNVQANNGNRTHLISIRPKLLFNGFENRVQLKVIEIGLVVDGNSSIKWELCVGQALTGNTTFNDVNTNYSAVEYNTAGTVSGLPTLVIDSGFVAGDKNSKGNLGKTVNLKIPITLDLLGAHRLNGRISVVLTGIGGNSDTLGSIKWIEIR
tara:strand:- start:16221 stop:17912 length:1692 start_codon:yes stop_codon:yes gene_type:complete